MVRNRITICISIVAIMLLATGAPLRAEPSEGRKVQLDLIAAVDSITPGQPFSVGVRQQITPHWHTYWKNPGDSGEPTQLRWSLPSGFEASEIQWPVPEAIPVGPLMNYGFSNELLLPVTITPPDEIGSDSVTLKADVDVLVCEEICVPESGSLTLTLPVNAKGTPPASSEHAGLFEHTKRNLPIKVEWPSSVSKTDGMLKLKIKATELDQQNIASIKFFPDSWGKIDHAAPQEVSWREDHVSLSLKPGDLVSGGKIPDLAGLLVVTEKSGGEELRNGFAIEAAPENIPPMALKSATASQQGGAAQIGLWQALAFAVLGGLILNLMPCVLPILSLKVLAFANHRGAEAVRSGAAYVAGVLSSFAVLALILALVKSGGESLGWGFQFQSPLFVLILIALFFTLGLSMSGVFHVGGSLAGVGDSLTRRQGLTGSFFTGVLASIAATPCTAPFMGAAVGFALTRSAPELFAVIMALGLGFALPLFALSVSPLAQRILPKPGPWMESFKELMAFPLYATVVWLVWVLAQQTGADGVAAAGIVLVICAFGAWLIGSRTGQSSFRLPIAIGLIAATIFLNQSWIANDAGDAIENQTSSASSAARQYSAEEVERLRAEGRPVFVNFTAAWCITCKVNERLALSTDGFQSALDEHGISYLKGDWTNKNDEIAQILKKYGRAGVPLYLLYPADTAQDAIILPQLLTEAIVLRHFAELNKAAKPIKTGAALNPERK